MATKKSTDTAAKPTSKPASKSATKTVTKPVAKAPAKKSAPSEKTATPAPIASAKNAPTHEEISRLAHTYWKERGHHHGSHEDDWHRAERELKSRS